METQKHSRRNALALIAGAVPALAATSTVARAAQGPSPEFLQCQALYREWLRLLDPKSQIDYGDEVTWDRSVTKALNEYYSALEALVDLPPSKQKLSELLSLAVMESKADSVGSEERDLLSADQALTAAMQTFEALGEIA